MFLLSRRAASALSLGALFVLASCSGGGGGSGSVPATQPVSPQSAHPQAVVANTASTDCTNPPAQSIRATVTSLSVVQGHTGTFTVCTQYATTYTVSVADSTIASATIGTAARAAVNLPLTATVTVTGKKAGGPINVTITDKKGHSVIVAVTVTPASQTFSYTGAAQTFTVPANVTQISVDAVGASGGIGNLNDTAPGGLGAETRATVPVTAGETLYVLVGGAGGPGVNSVSHPGFNGGGIVNAAGGGGGASDVRTACSNGTTCIAADLSTRLIVAGGGGGASGGNMISVSGGNGGTPNGSSGSFPASPPTLDFSVGAGGGATQTVGGTAGAIPSGASGGSDVAGMTGSLGVGGDQARKGGAGGGGYYGGGSGATWGYDCDPVTLGCDEAEGGGGGGSSFAVSNATNVVYIQATSGQCDANNNGCITISW